jgi:hypothetical protein
MKLSRETSSVELGGTDTKPQDFRIVASKEAFAILSSGLYNNQIGAIVRELSCNAWDAHAAANKASVPFAVHLPTRFEPFFAVEDYGVGLSEPQIYELYTCYFGTNKSESNDFIGALGLGSKSPFSYCEGFTVESKYNGIKTTYSCFINEQGKPSVQKQMEVSCLDEDEPFFAQSMNNGIKVQFPVKIHDCQEFANNAANMLEFFDPPPVINEHLVIKKQNYAMKTEKWGIRIQDYYSSLGVRAIQGKVAYSVGTIDQSKLTWEEKELLKQPLDIFFEIGELSVAASRETLKNDERTVANIIKAIQSIAGTYAEEMKKQLSQCANTWEAGIFIKKLLWSNNPLKNVLEKEYRKGTFDGDYGKFKINHEDGIKVKINEFDHMPVTLYKFTSTGYRSNQSAEKVRVFNEEEHRRKIKSEIDNKIRTNREDYAKAIEPNTNILFIIGDIPFGAEKFIHHFLQQAADNRSQGEAKITQVYLIARANKEVSVAKVQFEALSIINKLGNPPYQYLSALKGRYWEDLKEEKGESVDRGIVAFNVHSIIDIYNAGYEKKGWREGWSHTFEVDKTTKKFMIPKGSTKYYLRLKKGEPVDLHFDNAENFRQFILSVSQSGKFGFNHTKDKLYGMPENSQHLKDAQNEKYTDKDGFDHPEWVEFSQDVWNKLLKIMTPELEVQLSLQVKNFRAGELEEVFPAFSRELDPNCPMKTFIDSLDKAKSINATKAEALAKVIATASAHKIYELKHITDFQKEWDKVLERYPLLSLMNYRSYMHNSAEMKAAMINYIKLIDEQRRFEELLKEGDQHTQLYLEAQELDVQTEQQTGENDDTEEEVATGSEENSECPVALHPETLVCPSDSL